MVVAVVVAVVVAQPTRCCCFLPRSRRSDSRVVRTPALAGRIARCVYRVCARHGLQMIPESRQGSLAWCGTLRPSQAINWPRPTFSRKSHQGAPIFTHPLHHPANATLFPAKSAQEPIESPVFL